MDDSPIFIYFFDLNESVIPINEPNTSIIKIINLYILGKMRICWGFISHINNIPKEIDSEVIMMIGVFEKIWVWNIVSGLDFNENLLDINVIRIVYDAVNPIEKIIKYTIIRFSLEEIIDSIIESFEKNPDVNGIAISIILDNPKIDSVNG